MRAQASQLLDHGHPYAESYPIGKLWEENQLVVERLNKRDAIVTTLTKTAMATVAAAFGKDKDKAEKTFSKIIKELSGDG